MAIQNATNVAIRVGGQGVGNTIGYATSASLSVNMDLRDSTTKSSEGWQENLGGLKSWELSGDAFVEVDPTTDGSKAYLEELYVAWEARNAISCTFGMTGLTFTGNALITSISVDSGVEENATYSISLTGTGAITKS